MSLEFSAAYEDFNARKAEQKEKRSEANLEQKTQEDFETFKEIKTVVLDVYNKIQEKYSDIFEMYKLHEISSHIRDRTDALLWRICDEYYKGGIPLERNIEKYTRVNQEHNRVAMTVQGVDEENDKILTKKHGTRLNVKTGEQRLQLEIDRRDLHKELTAKLQHLDSAFRNAGLDTAWAQKINLVRFNIEVWAQHVQRYIDLHPEERQVA